MNNNKAAVTDSEMIFCRASKIEALYCRYSIRDNRFDIAKELGLAEDIDYYRDIETALEHGKSCCIESNLKHTCNCFEEIKQPFSYEVHAVFRVGVKQGFFARLFWPKYQYQICFRVQGNGSENLQDGDIIKFRGFETYFVIMNIKKQAIFLKNGSYLECRVTATMETATNNTIPTIKDLQHRTIEIIQ